MPPLATAVCVGENLVINASGQLEMAPWSVPRLLVDAICHSGGDTTKLGQKTSLPGVMLMEQQVAWYNDTPVNHDIRIEVTRRWKRWVTANPNAIQFRDLWRSAVTPAGQVPVVPPTEPVVTGLYNSITGSAVDVGTNDVAEPNPGLFYQWWGTNTAEEWITAVKPGETLSVWYRMYVWTPPPYDDNANKNSPRGEAEAGYARVALMGFPQQGPLVTNP